MGSSGTYWYDMTHRTWQIFFRGKMLIQNRISINSDHNQIPVWCVLMQQEVPYSFSVFRAHRGLSSLLYYYVLLSS